VKTQKYNYDVAHALATLRRNDMGLGNLIDRIGPYKLELRESKTPFQALLHSIVYQQLSGKAAASIHKRLLDLFPHRYACPARLMSLPEPDLLSAGLSRAKVKAAKDLAAKCENGTVPHSRRLKRMSDDEVIESLLQVRGIGVWTAEMLLLFHLGRPDILPIGDLGIVKGFRIAYGLDCNPVPKQLYDHGERWRPYRSVASWYLWQANYL